MGRSKGLLGIKVYPLRMPQSLFGGGEFSGLHLGEGRGQCCFSGNSMLKSGP